MMKARRPWMNKALRAGAQKEVMTVTEEAER